MGFLNEMRKALFGAKSVAKSQAEKAGEYVNEQGQKLKEQAEQAGEKAKVTAEDIWGKLETEAEDLWEEIADKKPETELTEEERLKRARRQERKEQIKQKAGEAWDKAVETSEEINKELFDKGEKLWDKTKGISEKVGDTLLDKGEEVFNKGKDLFDDLSEKAQKEWEEEKRKRGFASDDVVDQAKDKMDDMNVDDVNAQAHQMSDDIADEVARIRKKKSTDDSLLGGTDDFFERADRFAKGDYHNTGDKDAPKEGEVRLIDDVAKPSPKDGPVKGFIDRDGDGNEIIDDAIIDHDDDDKDPA